MRAVLILRFPLLPICSFPPVAKIPHLITCSAFLFLFHLVLLHIYHSDFKILDQPAALH